jgi:glycopeptide antibiotics resistance protein
MTNQSQHKPAPDSIVKWLFLLYLLFVIYGSLVPLQYVDRSLDDAIQTFKNIPFLELGIDSRADWVANLLLFIPLTLLASLLFNASGGTGRRVLVAFLLVFSAVFLAVGIEFTQLFFPQRTVSQNDIFAESVGGLVGIGCHWLFGIRIQTWLDGFWRHEQQQDRAIRVLHAYLIVLFVFGVLPLDLTLSPVELFHKWKEGRVVLVPFAGLKDKWSEALYETATDILIWIPAGLLWAMQPGSTLKRVVFRVIIASAVIEILQLFVYSRVTDITQVGLAGVGGFVGWAFVRGEGKGMSAMLGLLQRNWRSLWLAWVVLIVVIFWFPFNFNLEGLSGSTATEAFTRLPLTTYYFTSEFHATIELLRKVGFFVPGGLLLGFAAHRPNAGRRRSAAVPLVLLVLLAFGIEVGQLALPGKVADLTDALLESAGGLLGYLMAYWIGASVPSQPNEVAVTPVSRLDVAVPRLKPPPPPMLWLDGYKAHLAYVVGLSFVMGLLFRMPGVPYSLRALAGPGLGGAVSLLGLSLTAYGMADGVFLLYPSRRRRWFLAFPVCLVVQGLLAWCLLRVSAPTKSLDDIVGSAVLDWPWEWESLCRYLALHMALMLQVLGAALCVRAILKPATLVDFVYWATISVVLAWPLHLVVVEWAATDNLTELMAGDASFYSSCALAGALFLTCLAASALSAAPQASKQAVSLVGLALAAAMGATLLYWLGAEHTIVKYGRVFSAFQFLLSTDREHYAQGVSLMLRYVIAFATVCGGLATLQWPCWRWFCRTVSGFERQTSGRSGRP